MHPGRRLGRTRAFVKRLLARSSRFVIGTVLVASISFVVGHFLGGFLGGNQKPIPGQLEAILHNAAQHGLEPVNLREVDLQGTGALTHLIVFRPQFSYGHRHASDELRLYKTEHNELRLTFAMQPTPLEHAVPYEIALIGVGSFDRTDRKEVILTLSPEYADGRLPRPVALLWSAGSQTYELRALLVQRPRLVPLRGYWAITAATLDRPVDIPLQGGGAIRHAGGAQEVMVASSRLAVAYPVEKTCHGCDGVWEFRTVCLDFRYPPSPEMPPEEPSTPARRYRAYASDEAAMAREMRAALHRGYCE